MSTEKQPPAARRFRLLVESLPSSVPDIIRLRSVLKLLSRVYRFRAVRIEELPAEGEAQDPRPVGGQGKKSEKSM